MSALPTAESSISEGPLSRDEAQPTKAIQRRWAVSRRAFANETQNIIMKTLARIAAGLSFDFCLVGGIWILTKTGFGKSGDDAVWAGIGLYFVGKAFFVGPMLWLAAEKCCSTQGGANDRTT